MQNETNFISTTSVEYYNQFDATSKYGRLLKVHALHSSIIIQRKRFSRNCLRRRKKFAELSHITKQNAKYKVETQWYTNMLNNQWIWMRWTNEMTDWTRYIFIWISSCYSKYWLHWQYACSAWLGVGTVPNSVDTIILLSTINYKKFPNDFPDYISVLS